MPERVLTSWRENEKMKSLPMRTVRRLLACVLMLSALPLLASCASDPEVRVVTETRTVEVPVEVFKPLPETLTTPLPYPPPLSESFTVDDVLDLTFALYDLLDAANADRVRSGELTRPAPSEDIPQ